MRYFHHILRQLFRAGTLSLLACLALYLVFDMIEHVRILLAYRAPMGLLFDLALAHVPTAVYHLLPIAVLLGNLSVMVGMSARNETAALAAAGQSPFRRALPFLVFALFVGALHFGWGEAAAPEGERLYRNLVDITIKHKDRWGEKWRPERHWYAGPSGHWRVERREKNRLQGVSLYRMDAKGRLYETTDLAEMVWEERGWTVRSLVRRDRDGRVLERMEKGRAAFPETLRQFRMIWLSAEEMNLADLRRAVRIRRSQGLDSLGYETALWMRFSLPLLVPALVLLAFGAAWGRRRSRSNRAAGLLAVSLGVGMGLVGFLLVSIGKTVGEGGVCPPMAAAFLPVAVLWIAGGFSCRRMR